MAKKFIHKKSYTASEVPVPADLKRGELAINLPDKKIYTKDENDDIVDLTEDADSVGGIIADRIVYGANASATILAVTDLDNITKSGFYSCGPTLANIPFASEWCWLIHTEHENQNDYGSQMAIRNSLTNPTVAIRTQVNNVWGSWSNLIASHGTGKQTVDQNFEVSKTTAVDSKLMTDNSVGGSQFYASAAGNTIIAQASNAGAFEKIQMSYIRNGLTNFYYNGSIIANTNALGLDIDGRVSTGSGIAGGILFESGAHAINTNDGDGNFNIRIANSYATGCTEAGYAFHEVYDQAVGGHTWRLSSASLAVNDTPTWVNSFTISPTLITHESTIRPNTNLGANLGSASYNYANVYATNFLGKSSDSALLNNAVDSETMVVSTIVKRNNAGDIFARYVTMSHTAGTRNTDTVFYSSTDNYVRKNTASGTRTSLDVYSKAEAFTAGSNSDGTYVKHADGTLICTRPSISGSSSADTTWTFPLAFNTSSIAVTGNMVGSGSGIRAISLRTPSTTAVDFSIYNSSDARTGDNASLIAIGKWK